MTLNRTHPTLTSGLHAHTGEHTCESTYTCMQTQKINTELKGPNEKINTTFWGKLAKPQKQYVWQPGAVGCTGNLAVRRLRQGDGWLHRCPVSKEKKQKCRNVVQGLAICAALGPNPSTANT